MELAGTRSAGSDTMWMGVEGVVVADMAAGVTCRVGDVVGWGGEGGLSEGGLQRSQRHILFFPVAGRRFCTLGFLLCGRALETEGRLDNAISSESVLSSGSGEVGWSAGG